MGFNSGFKGLRVYLLTLLSVTAYAIFSYNHVPPSPEGKES